MNVLKSMFDIASAKSPENLFKLLIATAVTSIIAIIVISTYGFYYIYSRNVLRSAEENAVNICEAIIEKEAPLLFLNTPDKGMLLRIDSSNFLKLDQELRRFLRHFGIIKIKVYDNSGTILYSTDPNIVGVNNAGNKNLQIALAGRPDSLLKKKDKAVDLAQETVIDVDVVETYVPIRDDYGRILGSFEIYMNVTGYRNELRKSVIVSVSMLSVIILMVFGSSYRIIRRGTSMVKQAQDQLEKLAVTDSLTGLHNRRYLMERGDEDFERVRRNRFKGVPNAHLGCIVVDIDHFKTVNDTYGHFAGDRVLCIVAQRIADSVRPYDVIARFGGEEFAVLLPDTAFEQVMLVADRIWGNIRNDIIDVDGRGLVVTASLGVSCTNELDRNLGDLIKRADDGLYKAKKGGRDRIAWIYPSPVP